MIVDVYGLVISFSSNNNGLNPFELTPQLARLFDYTVNYSILSFSRRVFIIYRNHQIK